MAEHEYVQVAFPIPILETFTYVVPDHLRGRVVPGSHVTAFLGKRKLSGLVVGTEPRENLKNVRPLESLVRPDPVLDKSMLDLTKKVADYYLCPWGEILAAAYPAHAEKGLRVRQGEGVAGGGQTGGGFSGESLPADSLSKGGLDDDGSAAAGQPGGGLPDSSSSAGFRTGGFPAGDHSLESDLLRYFAPILDASRAKRNRTFVLSLPDQDRERIYPYLLDRIHQDGGSVIVLVPEVSTSCSLVDILKERFGEETALFHSRLRISERKRIWEKCRAGTLKVLIGTRSAIFLPARDLRLIVVEDEHAEPFKQEETPRYNSRDVAIMRATNEQIPLLLASATPSVESIWCAKRGEFELLEGAPLKKARPTIKVVDMTNRENVIPQSEELSLPLIEAMGKALNGGRKVLLFLNRRGFYGSVQCQECGFLETCPSCELPLIYHSESKSLVCHHCTHKIEAPSSCRKCGSTRFRYGGGGVEKVQTRLKRFFPSARVARIDLDSARTRPDAVKIARDFASGEIDILIGTMMVMKGLQLGELSLVGVIHAEAQLNLPDFRSGERAFQLLSDVVSLVGNGEGMNPGVGDSRVGVVGVMGSEAGDRAAGDREVVDAEAVHPGAVGSVAIDSEAGDREAGYSNGEVIIQTLNPDHHSILAIARHDPGVFYEQELKERKELGYPPFSSLIAFHVTGANEARVVEVVQQINNRVAAIRDGGTWAIHILGPAPAIPAKARGRFRWYLSIRGSVRDDVVAAAKEVMSLFGGKHEVAGVTISVDVDPLGV